jgi:ubiquinone/menaquinone biosynthesis C-methylase UbiE
MPHERRGGNNTFSVDADKYASSRPSYPAELYDWLASQCQAHEAAWDCATGNGQAAVGLSPYFNWVCASDISAEQLAHGTERGNVRYSVQSAESTNFPGNVFDLVVVAQALHWFDYPKFWAETRRVARPGAFFCAWGYAWLTTTPELDRKLVEPFRKIIAPFWAKNNRVLWDGYPSEAVQFPFARITSLPTFEVRATWNTEQLIAYMQTWSAYKRSRSDAAASARMDALLSGTRALVTGGEFTVVMPLSMLAGRIPSSIA